LNQIVNFVKTFGQELLRKRDKHKTIKSIFLFQNEFVESVFFRSLLENMTIEQAIGVERKNNGYK